MNRDAKVWSTSYSGDTAHAFVDAWTDKDGVTHTGHRRALCRGTIAMNADVRFAPVDHFYKPCRTCVLTLAARVSVAEFEAEEPAEVAAVPTDGRIVLDEVDLEAKPAPVVPEIFTHSETFLGGELSVESLPGPLGIRVITSPEGVVLQGRENVAALRDALTRLLGDEVPVPAPSGRPACFRCSHAASSHTAYGCVVPDCRCPMVGAGPNASPALAQAPAARVLTPPAPTAVPWDLACDECEHVAGRHTSNGCGATTCPCLSTPEEVAAEDDGPAAPVAAPARQRSKCPLCQFDVLVTADGVLREHGAWGKSPCDMSGSPAPAVPVTYDPETWGAGSCRECEHSSGLHLWDGCGLPRCACTLTEKDCLSR